MQPCRNLIFQPSGDYRYGPCHNLIGQPQANTDAGPAMIRIQPLRENRCGQGSV